MAQVQQGHVGAIFGFILLVGSDRGIFTVNKEMRVVELHLELIKQW